MKCFEGIYVPNSEISNSCATSAVASSSAAPIFVCHVQQIIAQKGFAAALFLIVYLSTGSCDHDYDDRVGSLCKPLLPQP